MSVMSFSQRKCISIRLEAVTSGPDSARRTVKLASGDVIIFRIFPTLLFINLKLLKNNLFI